MDSTTNQQEVNNFNHAQWLRQPETINQLRRLVVERDRLLLEASRVNQVGDSQCRIALNKLVEANSITNVIKYLNENIYPVK